MDCDGDDPGIVEVEKDEPLRADIDEVTVEVVTHDAEEEDEDDLASSSHLTSLKLEAGMAGEMKCPNLSGVHDYETLQRRRMSKREKEERLQQQRERELVDEQAENMSNTQGNYDYDYGKQMEPTLAQRITEHAVFDEKFYNRVYDLPFAILQRRRPVDPALLCKTTPRLFLDGGSGGDLTFLIDTCVPVSDILVDNLGKWTRQGMRTTTRTLYVNQRTICRKGEHDYIVEKRYGIHGNAEPDRSIRKVAWTMRTAFGEQLYSLISYRIQDGATVPFKAHGNAKSPAACIYQRILPSSIEKMKILRKTLTPKDITMRMVKSAGGLASVTDSQALPRNDKQLYNLSRYRCPNTMNCGYTRGRNKINRMNVEDIFRFPSKGFVQFTQRTSVGQRVFCATQSMITNFKHSCTETLDDLTRRLEDLNPPEDLPINQLMDFYLDEQVLEYSRIGPSILIVDQTYDLNEMYLTVFAFRNKRFIRRATNTHPLCIAAFCLTTHKEPEDYLWAATCLWNLCGSDENLRVRSFFTDGDPIMDSMRRCLLFSNPAVHIYCGVRLHRNSKTKLRELGASENQTVRILREIYGGETFDGISDNPQQCAGIIDCISEEHFNDTLETVVKHWPIKEFVDYFIRCQAGPICEGYLLPRRVEAGLGRGGTSNISNDIRGMNGMLRRYLRRSSDPGFHSIVQTLETFVRGQYIRLGESLFGMLGEYDLAPEYRDMWMNERTWKNATTAEKKAALYAIGIIEDEMEPAEPTFPLQSELPQSLQSIYTIHEWRRLLSVAKALVERDEIKRFDDKTFAVRDGAVVHTIQLIADVYHCTCTDKRPICAHNLAVSLYTDTTKRFVDLVGERKDFMTMSMMQRDNEVNHYIPRKRRSFAGNSLPEYDGKSSSRYVRNPVIYVDSESEMHQGEDDEDQHIIVADEGGDEINWETERVDRIDLQGEEKQPRTEREVLGKRKAAIESMKTMRRVLSMEQRYSRRNEMVESRYETQKLTRMVPKDEHIYVEDTEAPGPSHRITKQQQRLQTDGDEMGEVEEGEQDIEESSSLKREIVEEESVEIEKIMDDKELDQKVIMAKHGESYAKDKLDEREIIRNIGVEHGYEDEEEYETEYRAVPSKSARPLSFSERVTEHPVFDEKFYSRVYDVPVAILQKKRPISPKHVCKDTPMIYLDGLSGGNVSFIVDGSVPVPALLADNLGKWNGPSLRCTTRTLYLDSKTLCHKGEHEFILEKRYSIHANTTPERSIKKVIWTMRAANGEQLYSLVSYRIDDGALVPQATYSAYRFYGDNPYYQRIEPSTVTYYDEQGSDA